MKYFLVVVCAFALFEAVSCDKEEFKKAEEACVAEKKVDKSAIEEAMKGHFKDGDNMNCFAECIFKKVGFVKSDGTLDHEKMKASAKDHDEKHEAIAEKCTGKTGKDACETAHQIYKCYWEEVNA